jgi:hypothetical protein
MGTPRPLPTPCIHCHLIDVRCMVHALQGRCSCFVVGGCLHGNTGVLLLWAVARGACVAFSRVSHLPVDTPLRRRARTPVSSSVMEGDPVLERLLASIQQEAVRNDRATSARRRRALSSQCKPVLKEVGGSPRMHATPRLC